MTRPLLAIDSVSRHGSVSLIHGSTVLASSSEVSGNPARAEELLVVVTDLMDRAGITLGDLTAVAVAVGPGSYSGIRIGIASAMGLSSARNIPAFGVSLLACLAMTVDSGAVISAVRAGKRDVAYQKFDVDDGGPRAISAALQDPEINFVSDLGGSSRVLACAGDLATQLASQVPPEVKLRNAGPDLASLVGLFAARFPDRSPLEPFYLRSRGHEAGF